MKKAINYTLIVLFILISVNLSAQEEEVVPKKKDKPVRSPWESAYIIDNQTTFIEPKGIFEMVIHHRFGPVNNGITDLFGLYAPSNIRLGGNYSITNNLMVGFGTTKFKKVQDFQAKYIIINQTRSGAIPVSIAYFGNIAIEGRNKEFYGSEYKFTNRLSYFNQLIISRKFTNALSLQVSPGFLHYNMTDSLIDHDKLFVSFAGRYKVGASTSIIASYDLPLHFEGIREYAEVTNKATPNFGVGVELATATHRFQIFLGSSPNIVAQENIHYNQNDFFNGGILLGFNLTRLF